MSWNLRHICRQYSLPSFGSISRKRRAVPQYEPRYSRRYSVEVRAIKYLAVHEQKCTACTKDADNLTDFHSTDDTTAVVRKQMPTSLFFSLRLTAPTPTPRLLIVQSGFHLRCEWSVCGTVKVLPVVGQTANGIGGVRDFESGSNGGGKKFGERARERERHTPHLHLDQQLTSQQISPHDLL